MAQHKNHLANSYQLDSVENTQEFYSDWAATYDAEILANGYATPQRCADALENTVSNKNLSILDIGCGTGLSGKVLSDKGFSNIDGCDINPEMLALAKSRNIYQKLWLSNPNNPFPFDAGTYDVITAIGVIGAGAAPLDVFHAVTKKLTTGGLLVFSFNDHTLEDSSYETAVKNEINNNNYQLITKEYGNHLPGRGIKSNVYVMRKT